MPRLTPASTCRLCSGSGTCEVWRETPKGLYITFTPCECTGMVCEVVADIATERRAGWANART